MAIPWSLRLIRAALRLQNDIVLDVSEDTRLQGAGRKGRLAIEGKDGGEMFLRWDGDSLVEEATDEGCRNEFFMASQTLYDLATGELSIRDAIAARLIRVTGDRSLYDSEEIAQLFEELQRRIVDALRVRAR